MKITNKVEAIKEFRSLTNCSLKFAKAFVEQNNAGVVYLEELSRAYKLPVEDAFMHATELASWKES